MNYETTMDPTETEHNNGVNEVEEDRDELHAAASADAGSTAVGQEVELASYDHYKQIYPDMDWTPESMG